jgi:hypothetical protein
MLSKCNVILSASEGSQDPNMRFFRLLWEDKSSVGASNAPISRCRQNDKMIVDFCFDTPSFCMPSVHVKRLSVGVPTVLRCKMNA